MTRMMKKLSGILLALMLLFGIMPTAALAAETAIVNNVEELKAAAADPDVSVIRMGKSFNMSSSVTLDHDVTFDLNGFCMETLSPGNVLYINAKVTLTDSSSGKNGIIQKDTSGSSSSQNLNPYAIRVGKTDGYDEYGELTIESGTISGTRGAVNVDEGCKLTVNGGWLVGGFFGVDNHGEMIMSGGKVETSWFSSTAGNGPYGVSILSGAKLTVTGGEISGSDCAVLIPDNEYGEILMTGGTLTGEINSIDVGSKGKILKTGGTLKAGSESGSSTVRFSTIPSPLISFYKNDESDIPDPRFLSNGIGTLANLFPNIGITGWNTVAEPTPENPGVAVPDKEEIILNYDITLYAQRAPIPTLTLEFGEGHEAFVEKYFSSGLNFDTMYYGSVTVDAAETGSSSVTVHMDAANEQIAIDALKTMLIDVVIYRFDGELQLMREVGKKASYQSADEYWTEYDDCADNILTDGETFYALWAKPAEIELTVAQPPIGTTVVRAGSGATEHTDPFLEVSCSEGVKCIPNEEGGSWFTEEGSQFFLGTFERGGVYYGKFQIDEDFGWYITDKAMEDAAVNGAVVLSRNISVRAFSVMVPTSEFKVTVTNDGHGTGSAAPGSGVIGTPVTLTAKPNNGYQFKEWQVISGGITVSDDQFTIAAEDVEIKAVFEPKDFTVTFANYDGTVLQSGKVKFGEKPAYTGSAPSREADGDICSYTFAGWDNEIAAVTGDTTYTAVFTPESHAWDVTFTFSGSDAEGYTAATATFVCKNDKDHTHTVKAEISVETTDASCEKDGTVVYTATVSADNSPDKTEHSDSKTVKTAATGHDWGDPTYEWAQDNSSVTATRICANDKEHVETETVKTAAEATTPAACEKKGKTTYTATFTNEAFAVQSRTEEDIDALGHDWSEWKVTKEPEAGKQGERIRTCSRCGETEKEAIDALVAYTVTEGAQGTWTKGSTQGFTLTVKRSENDASCFSHYIKTTIDGTTVSVSAKSGSTIVEISAEALEALSEGSHTVAVHFDDGVAETALTVRENPDGPKTGDDAKLTLWIAIQTLSILAIAGVFVFGRKRALNR